MKRTIIISLVLALTLTACQERNLQPEGLPREMKIAVLAPGVHTKASAESFEEGDRVGLFVADYIGDATPLPLQISGNRATNVAADFDGAAWNVAKTIYWGEGKSDVYAYYPYIENISEIDNQVFAVAEDQNTLRSEEDLGGYEASDLLWAKAEGVNSAGGAVTLPMKHLLSKLTLRIVAGEDYIGSLPSDASVLLHNTVTGARIDFAGGSVVKDPYCGAKSINMRKLGIRTFDGVDAVVFEAIVVPQMLETSVPFLEINSKSVSYLIEDSFNFRPGVAYTYTATLNTSTTAIKVDIGCEIEDWNNAGGSGSGDSGEGGEDSGEGGEDDGRVYTDLSADGTANCYLISQAGDYKFKTVLGNTDGTVGNVKSVEVLWESFGTNVMPNVGDLITSVSYKDGYVRFSTPETFANGNAVIAVRNSTGTILWSWHIWCSEEGWQEHIYNNDAGTMMDRNLGATASATWNSKSLGLCYQGGRKDPFLGSSSYSSSVQALSTGTWEVSSLKMTNELAIANPTTFFPAIPIVYHCQTGSQRKLHTTLALTGGEFQMEVIMEYGQQRDLLEKLPQTVDTEEISTSVLQK
ncbi:MAG: fimbrillin family protein [Candidatus Cryptobacteroides sp.]